LLDRANHLFVAAMFRRFTRPVSRHAPLEGLRGSYGIVQNLGVSHVFRSIDFIHVFCCICRLRK
jgi:hypothetical protein